MVRIHERVRGGESLAISMGEGLYYVCAGEAERDSHESIREGVDGTSSWRSKVIRIRMLGEGTSERGGTEGDCVVDDEGSTWVGGEWVRLYKSREGRTRGSLIWWRQA